MRDARINGGAVSIKSFIRWAFFFSHSVLLQFHFDRIQSGLICIHFVQYKPIKSRRLAIKWQCNTEWWTDWLTESTNSEWKWKKHRIIPKRVVSVWSVDGSVCMSADAPLDVYMGFVHIFDFACDIQSFFGLFNKNACQFLVRRVRYEIR